MDGNGEAAIERVPHPIATLFEVLRTTGYLGDPTAAFTQLVERAKEEYFELLGATTPHEVVGRARLYHYAEQLNDSDHVPEQDVRRQCSMDEANLVGSLCQDGKHRPVIDLDQGAQFVPSSTPGHGHLYLDTAMDEATYFKFLQAFADAGVVSRYFVKAAVIRGQSFVRVPWVRKPKVEPEKTLEEMT